ncbi:MAG: DinB family protein [Cyclobacteriaceae bacterium]
MVALKPIADELRQLVKTFAERCGRLSEEEFSAKPNPAKWSKKEVLGHLIDSAHNNIRRFIVAQYASEPPHIIYEQDFWVKVNDYQHMKSEDVIKYWVLINERISHILETMPSANLEKLADTGREGKSTHSIEWLAQDYVKHMKHHLNQIFAGSFDVVYI